MLFLWVFWYQIYGPGIFGGNNVALESISNTKQLLIHQCDGRVFNVMIDIESITSAKASINTLVVV